MMPAIITSTLVFNELGCCESLIQHSFIFQLNGAEKHPQSLKQSITLGTKSYSVGYACVPVLTG